MLKALLFDFDGVIVHSEPLHLRSFRELFGPMGVRISKKRWYQEFTGIGSPAIIRILFRDFKIKKNPDAWVEKRKEYYQKLVRAGHLKTIPGVRAFLRSLRKRGIKTAIVSGGHITNIRLVLQQLKLAHLFNTIVSVDQVVKRKPHPEGFLLAMQRLHVKPENCIAIEDSPSGITAAHASGATVVCVRSPAPMDQKKCNYVIKDFCAFPKKLLG